MKTETLEQASVNYGTKKTNNAIITDHPKINSFIEGANWQKEQLKPLIESHSEFQSIAIDILFYLQNLQKGTIGAKLHDKIVQQLEKAKQITI